MRYQGLGLLVLVLSLPGCFRAAPGGLQGAWEFSQTFDNANYRLVESYNYTFDGDNIKRTLEQEIRDKNSGDQVVLRAIQTGKYQVDTTLTPNRMSIDGIQEVAYPSKVDFAVAAAIEGGSAADQDLFFGESMGLSFQPKAVYARTGDSLQIKFGSDTVYPATLAPPAMFTLTKAFRLFP